MSGGIAIGAAAAAAGVTTRTLRYYEQLGLLTPHGRSVGGARRYSDDDIARIDRIRRLQELLGQDLEQIRLVLSADDRLAELRAEWRGPAATERRQREILAEAMEINAGLRGQVRARQEALGAFAAELEDKARMYERVARDLGVATRR